MKGRHPRATGVRLPFDLDRRFSVGVTRKPEASMRFRNIPVAQNNPAAQKANVMFELKQVSSFSTSHGSEVYAEELHTPRPSNPMEFEGQTWLLPTLFLQASPSGKGHII